MKNEPAAETGDLHIRNYPDWAFGGIFLLVILYCIYLYRDLKPGSIDFKNLQRGLVVSVIFTALIIFLLFIHLRLKIRTILRINSDGILYKRSYAAWNQITQIEALEKPYDDADDIYIAVCIHTFNKRNALVIKCIGELDADKVLKSLQLFCSAKNIQFIYAEARYLPNS